MVDDRKSRRDDEPAGAEDTALAERLGAYLDGELDPDQRARVDEELAANPTLRDRLLELGRVDEILRAYAVLEEPSALADLLMGGAAPAEPARTRVVSERPNADEAEPSELEAAPPHRPVISTSRTPGGDGHRRDRRDRARDRRHGGVRPRPDRLRVIVAAGGLLLALVATIAVLVSTGERDAIPPPEPPAIAVEGDGDQVLEASASGPEEVREVAQATAEAPDTVSPSVVSVAEGTGGGPVEGPPSYRLRLTITSEPARARVILNGEVLGRTPFEGEIHSETPTVTIMVRKTDYETERFDLDLTQRKEAAIDVELRSANPFGITEISDGPPYPEDFQRRDRR